MNSGRRRDERKNNFKKEKQLIKLINEKSESDNESEHELSYYVSDRVKLMKEVLKIIKPKKIRSMAPQFMRNMDNEEINSMLLEELLGISNKRLKYIFNGQNLEEDSSSTDPEDDQKPIDVISLDDISDDALENIIDLDSDNESKRRHCRKHRQKIKEEPRRKKVKKERLDEHNTHQLEKGKTDKEKDDNPVNEQNLMSVLELLELQARARAIRSQLALESSKKQEETQKAKEKKAQNDDDDDDDDVIIEVPKHDEIVITSSDSENENNEKKKDNGDDFWKGQKPTNGSFYGNSEDLNTTQNNDQEDTTKQSSDNDQDSSNTSKTKVSGGRKAVIIQQVEIIRPADSSEKMDSGDITNIPLPVRERNKTFSNDGKNLEETTEGCRNVDNEKLEDVSKAGESIGKDINDPDTQETSNDENVPSTVQKDDVEKANKCDLKGGSAKCHLTKKSEGADENTQSDLVPGETVSAHAMESSQHVSVDEKTGDGTKKDKTARISTTKEKEEKIGCEIADMKNENLRKEAKDKEKQTVTETDSNKNLLEHETEKISENLECKSKDVNFIKKSEQKQESKATSDSSGSKNIKNSDVSPKKSKGKCKRRMAVIKARQRTSCDETPDGNHSETKESSEQQKPDKKSTDDDKNNSDDGEGIVLHYDQGDIECIILD
nr:unnamed protein product [Callosobruchus chinensis]